MRVGRIVVLFILGLNTIWMCNMWSSPFTEVTITIFPSREAESHVLEHWCNDHLLLLWSLGSGKGSHIYYGSLSHHRYVIYNYNLRLIFKNNQQTVACIDKYHPSNFYIRKLYTKFTGDSVALKFVTSPTFNTHWLHTCNIHTQIPSGQFLDPTVQRRTGLLPSSCALYTWELWDPRMLPWCAGMVGTKER